MLPKREYIKELVSAGLLASLIVGAGIFALPQVFARAGIIYGLIALIFFAWVSYSINIRYADIIDRNGDQQRFAGYAKNYFSNTGYLFALIFVLGGIIFALTAYVALAPFFVSLITPFLSGSITTLLFWIVATVVTLSGIKKVSAIGIVVFIAMMAIIIALGVFAFIMGSAERIADLPLFNPMNLLLPFGPLLFAFSGRAAISSIRTRYTTEEYSLQKFRKVIRMGVVVPAILYVIFVVATIALSDKGITPEAVTGLTILPAWSLAIIGIFGLFAIFTSYILLGMEFIGIISKDTKLPRFSSYVLFAVLPIFIYFFGTSNFLMLVGIAGGIFLAFESIMVVLMGRHIYVGRWTDFILITTFVLGIIYEIVGLFA